MTEGRVLVVETHWHFQWAGEKRNVILVGNLLMVFVALGFIKTLPRYYNKQPSEYPLIHLNFVYLPPKQEGGISTPIFLTPLQPASFQPSFPGTRASRQIQML